MKHRRQWSWWDWVGWVARNSGEGEWWVRCEPWLAGWWLVDGASQWGNFIPTSVRGSDLRLFGVLQRGLGKVRLTQKQSHKWTYDQRDRLSLTMVLFGWSFGTHIKRAIYGSGQSVEVCRLERIYGLCQRWSIGDSGPGETEWVEWRETAGKVNDGWGVSPDWLGDDWLTALANEVKGEGCAIGVSVRWGRDGPLLLLSLCLYPEFGSRMSALHSFYIQQDRTRWLNR